MSFCIMYWDWRRNLRPEYERIFNTCPKYIKCSLMITCRIPENHAPTFSWPARGIIASLTLTKYRSASSVSSYGPAWRCVRRARWRGRTLGIWQLCAEGRWLYRGCERVRKLRLGERERKRMWYAPLEVVAVDECYQVYARVDTRGN